MYHSLLVPLDGSVESEHALPVARSIALHAHATLHLAHVHMPSQIIYIDGLPVIDEALHSLSREHERTYLQTIAQRLTQHPDLALSVANLEGPVVPTLLAHAAATATDLIIMTTHGRGGLSRLWLGSVADNLIHRTTVPLLVVRPQAAPPDLTSEPIFRHILIPLDGSALAEQILESAVALGTLMEADYTFLYVVQRPLLAGRPPITDLDERAHETMARAQHEAQRYLDSVAHQLQAQGLQVHTRVITAHHPASAILEEVRQHPTDLIALATHGRSGVARLLLSSVADKVLRGAETPVLLYRPKQTS
jgi:nucleotide-binding universal stress UspA family protein